MYRLTTCTVCFSGSVRWNQQAAEVHEDYRTAKREFKRALEEVILFHHPRSAAEVERECAEILALVRRE